MSTRSAVFAVALLRFAAMSDLERPETTGTSGGFFDRYFEALDGPDPLSALELISSQFEFAILFSTKTDERSRQFVGGPDELRAFTEAGDMTGWAHHILNRAVIDGVEIVLGETRRNDGTHLGTFVNAARLDDEGRMTHYLTARSPGLQFEPACDEQEPRS
jgi:hypothetical protein